MKAPHVAAPAVSKLLPMGPVQRVLTNPGVLVVLGISLLLTGLVANPLWQLVSESLRVDGDGYGWANYAAAFERPRYVQAFINSIKLGVVAAAGAVLIALPLAWGVSRTSMPGRNFVHMSVVASFLIPPFVGAIGWILLGGPNAGWINRVWMILTGTDSGLVNVFTFGGLAFVISLYTFPLVYILTKSALDLVSTELEEAAAILGAGPIRATFMVTLPIVLPAIIGSSMLVFLEVLGLFGTPALIGIPAGYNVITTQLAAFFEYPVRTEVAAAFAMPLVGITVLLLGVQKIVLRRKGFVTVTGKGGARQPINIGAWGWILLGYAVLIAFLSVVLPMFTTVQGAFSQRWSQGWSAENLTFENFYQALFVQESVRSSLVNTLAYSMVTATCCAALGFAVAYIVQRRLIPFAGLLSGLTLAPFAIPGIVLAICFYAAYSAAPFYLYGTATIIILAFIARSLPIAFVNSTSAIQGLHPELEEAVRISGGSRAQGLFRVVLPVLKRSLFGSWLLIFIISTRELSTAMFLTGPNTRVLSVLMIEMSEEGQYEILSATAVLLVIFTAVVCWLGARQLGRDFMLRRNQ